MKGILVLILMTINYFTICGQPCFSESLEVRNIKANSTDNNINREIQNHQVYVNLNCVPNNKLLLHLVGSFDNPANTTFFPTIAANHGYKVIVLKYPNGVSTKGACASSSDPDCFWKYRQEIIFGIDTSTKVSVDSNDCIMNRFVKLLIHLDNQYPSENWDNFLLGLDSLNWSDLVLSGHSQGGGHAAFLAKRFEVSRVLMFASPNDFSTFFSAPASWISTLSATPDSNYYAFGNLFDDVAEFTYQYKTWETMNLLKNQDTINVERPSCVYNNSKVLYTQDTSSSIISGNHNAMVIDKFTPTALGVPVFIPVWKYMLGLCELTTSIPNDEDFKFNIEVYPNPTNSKLFVESEKAISQVEIFDLSGKLLEVLWPNNNNFELGLDSYHGLLLVRLSSVSGRFEMIKVMAN